MSSKFGARTSPPYPCGRAFTLVELLVVLAIIAVVVAILLPGITAARAQANLIQCMSNERQLCQGLINYANVNRGRFPPNVTTPDPGQYWCDDDRLKGYGNVNFDPASGHMVGTLLTCPADQSAMRSYSMNIWASSKVDDSMRAPPATGCLWNYTVKRPSSMILIAESWSYILETRSAYRSPPTIGFLGSSAAARFGALGGITPPLYANRWGWVSSELPYNRHRPLHGRGRSTEPVGRVNIGYADGHVAAKTDTDLVNRDNGLCTSDSFWSPMDFAGQ